MADKIVGMEVGPATSGVPVKYVDQGDGTFALKIATTSGGGGGGGAVTVADGADATQGAIADAAVAAGATGTIGAKLRAISRDIGTLLSQIPATLGLKASATSMSVVQASDDAQFGTEASGFAGSSGASGLRGRLSEISTAIRGVLSFAPSDTTSSGTINVLNANPTSGVATAGSAVQVACAGCGAVEIYISANTLGANATLQYSPDGTNWFSVLAYETLSTGASTNSNAFATGTTGAFQVRCTGAKFVRLSANTATVSGSLTVQLNATVANPYVNLVNISGFTGFGPVAVVNTVGGTVNVAMCVAAANATTSVDYSAISVAAASGNGTTITDAAGAIVSFDINLSTFTAGTSTGLDLFLEFSPDGGTTWDPPAWQCEALTAAAHIRVPPIVATGARRRFRWVNRTGAATTAVLTVTVNRMSVVPPHIPRQYFDRTSTLVGISAGAVSVGATTTGWNNGTATAGLGYDTGGNNTISAIVPPLSAATTAATYQLQVCSFNSTTATDWVGVGTAVQASTTTATRMTQTGITERFFRVICTVAGAGQTGSYIALMAS